MRNIQNKIEYLLIALIVIAGVATIFRCFFSVDITDESYIYADALMTINGNIPYAYNFSESAGFSFAVIPFLWVYKLIVPSLSGVVLYMRLCFAVLRLLMVYAIYRLLIKKHSERVVLLICLILSVWFYLQNAISYNNTPAWTMMLASVLLYIVYDMEYTKNTALLLVIAGVLSGLTVFTHPFYAPSIFLLVILLFCLGTEENRIKNVLTYCMGGILQIAVVLGGIVIQVGVRQLLRGIRCMLIYSGSLASKNIGYRYYTSLYTYRWLFLIILFSFLSMFIIKRTYWIELGVITAVFAGTIYAVIFSGIYKDLFRFDACLGTNFLVISIIIFVFRKNKTFLILALPFIVFVLLEMSLYSQFSCEAHNAFAIPCILSIILEGNEVENKYLELLFIVMVVFVFINMLIIDTTYVYRDDALEDLKYKVEEGVYKGLYTTETRQKCLPEMEKYIKEMTDGIDNVAFRDCAPFAYLMYGGKMCDIQTWDAMGYKYSMNDLDVLMYRYYMNCNQIPLRIIYIDFGRDKQLSREKEKFKYNRWVDAYYTCWQNIKLNEMFRKVEVYDYRGNFDGDFSKWVTE